MGIFGSILGLKSTSPTEETYWNTPQSESEIDAILKTIDKPQIIYKHSPRCGTSLMTKNNLEAEIESIKNNASAYIINVFENREISDYVAKKTGVGHESPQVILLHKGKTFWYGSHGDARPKKVLDALDELPGMD